MPSPQATAAPVVRPVGPTVNVSEDPRPLVRGVMSSVAPQTPPVERRRDHRVPYPQLLRLTPVDDDGQTPLLETHTVVGKYLSESGLSFYHPTPLPFRWAIVELESAAEHCVRLLVDLDWCRFTRQGWYESGGRFVRVAGG